MGKRVGRQTVVLQKMPAVLSSAAVVGKKEGQGPLGYSFDEICHDSYLGKKTWEQAESLLQEKALGHALSKAGLDAQDIHLLFAGDLLNQCIGSTYGLLNYHIPYFGLFGACSTMAESMALAAMSIDSGFAQIAAAVTSSHFCSAERQFRFPLEYGNLRPPTAQWTVTGAGAVLLGQAGQGPRIAAITPGKMIDAGITDMGNMGAAMAPAAYDTISTHLQDLTLQPEDYDLILTGDLGRIGHDILIELFRQDGIHLTDRYKDCGMMVFDQTQPDIASGGSGCGCSASVLCGHILPEMIGGAWQKVLFCATGALMSPTASQQGAHIPGICCAVSLLCPKGV